MRQKVKALAASGKSAVEISMKLYLPLTTVKRWLA
jgi:hypothetical protein